MRLLLILLVLLAGGCGYRPEGAHVAVAGERPRLNIELLQNRTGRAFLENIVSTTVVQRFSRGGLYQVVEASAGPELLLSGQVSSYATVAIAYDHLDRIVLYRASMAVDVTLSKVADGRVLWKGTVSEATEYDADADRARQQTNENRATNVLAERIADELYALLASDF